MTNFHFILQSLFIFLGFDTLVLSELPRPRGVSISRAAIYTPKETFLCEDGSKTIKYIQINDDFCDCADGSDEPGTSACSNGIFHCMNLGHRPKNIPSSRVNDGICDCCDASDEYNSMRSQCVNNCMELGREEHQRERNRQELIKKGTMLRADFINKGKTLKDERKKKMVELQNRKAESEAIRDEKDARKKEAEAAEQEALEVYRQMQEAENREKLEKDADENRNEAENIFTKFDSNKDGFVEIIEIQTRVAFDKDRDGVVTVEEAKFFLDERDRVDLETFITLAWPRIKPYLMLDSGLFKPPLTENENEHENEPELDNQDYSGSEQHEEQNEEITDTDATRPEDEDEGEEHIEDENEEKEIETATAREYDPETQKLIDLANAARSEFLETDRTVREIEDEIKETKELIEKDYGVEEEFAPLDGECFTFDDREYVYKLCPFDRASQHPRSGGSEVRLGTWYKWNGNENKYSQMLYSNGASCWNGPQRSVAVTVECGLENKITSVAEPNRCEYHFVFQTPAACYLVDDTQKKDFHDEL